ncbi:MAG TPA: P1 family peptidase [Thermomicrobiales bacterium]
MMTEPNLSPDSAPLLPQTAFDGPALEFDFPGLRIGVAEYAEGPTGCTVFSFPDGARMATDVRGGSPGFLGDYDQPDAICLAGGSLYGLEAATGVAAALLAERGYSTHFAQIAAVSSAIIFDFGGRDNAIYPDKALGAAAFRTTSTGPNQRFLLGARGAGRSASVGNGLDFDRGEPGGQGAAFRQIGATKLAVFTVLNAIGAIIGRDGTVVRGHLDRATGQRHTISADLERRLAAGGQANPRGGNTTLTVVVTDQRLDSNNLRQFGRQVHSSMARAIQPFHTVFDGDILFAVTTEAIENNALSPLMLGVLASDLAWDAVLSAAAASG